VSYTQLALPFKYNVLRKYGSRAVLVLSSTTNIALNTDTLVKVSRISGIISFYINGELAGSIADNTNYSAIISQMSIGAQVFSRNSAYDFNGNIWNIKINKG
jgi:hypothetical protein